jgi:hypothetical protein
MFGFITRQALDGSKKTPNRSAAIACQVGSNAEEPGKQRARAIKSTQSLVGADKGLLGDVFGFGFEEQVARRKAGCWYCCTNASQAASSP